MTIRACPDDQVLTAFVAGKLGEHERPPVVDHVDGCASCFNRVTALALELEPPVHAYAAVPDALIRAVTTDRPSMTRRLAPVGALAAGVLLAVALWPPRAAPPAPSPPEPVRSSRAAPALPILEEPRDGDSPGPAFAVRWQAPAGAVFSEVKLTTAGGDLLWSIEVQGATSEVAVPVALPAGDAAYLWVTTHLPEGRRVTSNVVRLQGPARP